jgi:uncharacterized protein
MSAALLGAVFLASAAGSLHCVGMCGGLVAFVGGGRASAALYHAMRGLAYLALGAAAGALGAALDFGGAALGWSRIAMLLAGVTMLGFGFAALARARGYRLPKMPVPARFRRIFARAHQVASVQGPLVRAGLLGALTALLPCGWLYAFVLTAAGTGSPWSGTLVMLVFWAGTVPALLALGFGVRLLATPLMRRAPTLTAWLLVAIGLTTLSGRIDFSSFEGRVEAATSVADVQALGESTPPCCEEEQ